MRLRCDWSSSQRLVFGTAVAGFVYASGSPEAQRRLELGQTPFHICARHTASAIVCMVGLARCLLGAFFANKSEPLSARQHTILVSLPGSKLLEALLAVWVVRVVVGTPSGGNSKCPAAGPDVEAGHTAAARNWARRACSGPRRYAQKRDGRHVADGICRGERCRGGLRVAGGWLSFLLGCRCPLLSESNIRVTCRSSVTNCAYRHSIHVTPSSDTCEQHNSYLDHRICSEHLQVSCTEDNSQGLDSSRDADHSKS